MMYTVRNRCEEIPELGYDDGLTFLYFNTKGKICKPTDRKKEGKRALYFFVSFVKKR